MSSPSCPSSSPLPSPRTILQQLKAKQILAAENPKPPAAVDNVWEIPDSDGDSRIATPPPAPKAKNSRKPRAVAESKPAKVTKPRKPRTTTAKTLVATAEEHNVESEENEDRSAYFSLGPATRSGNVQEQTATESKESTPPRNHSSITRSDHPQSSPAPSPQAPLTQHRREWTPVRSLQDADITSSPPAGTPAQPAVSFGDKIAAFMYKRESTSESHSKSRETTMPPSRRRSLEIVAMPNGLEKVKPEPVAARAAPAKKPKRTKKKPTTITGAATAKYGNEAVTSSPVLTQYFSVKKTTSSRTRKTNKTSTKKTKEVEPEVILLSPDAAQKNLESQSFVFGTCSQLEQGSQKEVAMMDLSVETTRIAENELISIGSCIQRNPKEGLWSAARCERDIKEEWHRLVNYNSTLNDYNDAALPPVLDDPSYPDSPSRAPPRARSKTPERISLLNSSPRPSPLPLDHLPSSPLSSPIFAPRAFSTTAAAAASRKKSPKRSKPAEEHAPSPTTSPSTPTRRSHKRKSASPSPAPPSDPPASPSPTSNPAPKRTRQPSRPPSHPDMPDFAALPLKALQTHVSRYGFKKSQSKSALVAIAQQCWIAEHTSTPLPLHLPPARSRPARSKSRSSSRTRKRSRSPRYTAPKAPARPETDTAHRLSARTMFAKIAEAVRREEPVRADGQRKPEGTFWRRMLMYDPVIVEELAAWLNEEGLGAVGVDEEVTVAEVREWCNEVGVVGVGRETQKKKERTRY